MGADCRAILVVGRKFNGGAAVERFLTTYHVNRRWVNDPLGRDFTRPESMWLDDVVDALGLSNNVGRVNYHSNEAEFYIGWPIKLEEDASLKDFEDAYNYALVYWTEHFGLMPAYIISELEIS